MGGAKGRSKSRSRRNFPIFCFKFSYRKNAICPKCTLLVSKMTICPQIEDIIAGCIIIDKINVSQGNAA